MARASGFDRPQPLAGGECFAESTAGAGGVGLHAARSPQGAGGVHVLEGQHITANQLCRVGDVLQPALVPGTGRRR